MIEQLSLSDHVWDLCVVGTGPVGMALALEFDRLGKTVLVLESGAEKVDPVLQDASRAEIADLNCHAPMHLAVCRALGGTSWTWGGRCVGYDDVDWINRGFVADAPWPLSQEEIRPWYSRAAEYLLCGKGAFSVPFPRRLEGGLTIDGVERWARESKVILAYRDRLLQSERIKLSLNTTVTGLNLSDDGERLHSLLVATPNGRFAAKARRVVLAMGGVENTRLLLCTQQRWPAHFGGIDGPLGRYYMGHISGKVADIVFNDPQAIYDFDFKQDENGAYFRRRFMLDSESQLKNRVLNTAFWPDNPCFYDPSHRSGVLSSVFLALALPATGRRLVSEPIRLMHTGPRPYHIGAHIRNTLLGAPRGAKDIYRILRDRLLKTPRKPGFLVPNRSGRYALHYHAEQIPNPESRIRLSNETDAFGVSRARVDLRFMDRDVQSVVQSHDLLHQALHANGIGCLDFRVARTQIEEAVYQQATDGFHQIGTTRMGDDPKRSVVNSDLKVHGIDNLYVASSSVFPVSGQANSTFLAVAFATRLAAHLHSLR